MIQKARGEDSQSLLREIAYSCLVLPTGTQAELKELKDYIETLPISSTPSRVAKECYFRGLKSLNNRN